MFPLPLLMAALSSSVASLHAGTPPISTEEPNACSGGIERPSAAKPATGSPPAAELSSKPDAPLQWEDSFDTTPAGGLPRMARVNEGGGAGSVRVTTEAPRAGKHCLKITHGANVKPGANPHFHYAPHHRDGVTRVAFSIRVAPTVAVVHEWRDKSAPARTGAVVRIENGWITSSGQRLAPIDDGEWVRIELSMNLGAASDGTFDAVIRRGGEAPERYSQLPCADANVQEISWIGFTTTSSAASAWWLDDLNIANTTAAAEDDSQ